MLASAPLGLFREFRQTRLTGVLQDSLWVVLGRPAVPQHCQPVVAAGRGRSTPGPWTQHKQSEGVIAEKSLLELRNTLILTRLSSTRCLPQGGAAALTAAVLSRARNIFFFPAYSAGKLAWWNLMECYYVVTWS